MKCVFVHEPLPSYCHVVRAQLLTLMLLALSTDRKYPKPFPNLVFGCNLETFDSATTQCACSPLTPPPDCKESVVVNMKFTRQKKNNFYGGYSLWVSPYRRCHWNFIVSFPSVFISQYVLARRHCTESTHGRSFNIHWNIQHCLGFSWTCLRVPWKNAGKTKVNDAEDMIATTGSS